LAGLLISDRKVSLGDMRVNMRVTLQQMGMLGDWW
jgi:hypothetical protein